MFTPLKLNLADSFFRKQRALQRKNGTNRSTNTQTNSYKLISDIHKTVTTFQWITFKMLYARVAHVCNNLLPLLQLDSLWQIALQLALLAARPLKNNCFSNSNKNALCVNLSSTFFDRLLLTGKCKCQYFFVPLIE